MTTHDIEPERAELLPCPFCGAGKTEVRENGRPWLGTRWGEPSSVSVRHWCEPIDGQPSRMIERVGRDRAAAIAAWNRRAALQSQDREDAERYRWLRNRASTEGICVVHIDYWSKEYRGQAHCEVYDGEFLDKAIDHARRIGEEEGGA